MATAQRDKPEARRSGKDRSGCWSRCNPGSHGPPVSTWGTGLWCSEVAAARGVVHEELGQSAGPSARRALVMKPRTRLRPWSCSLCAVPDHQRRWVNVEVLHDPGRCPHPESQRRACAKGGSRCHAFTPGRQRSSTMASCTGLAPTARAPRQTAPRAVHTAVPARSKGCAGCAGPHAQGPDGPRSQVFSFGRDSIGGRSMREQAPQHRKRR